MRDMKSQVQKTGHSALNAKDSGMNSILRLKVISPISVTFSKHILLGDALLGARVLKSVHLPRSCFL